MYILVKNNAIDNIKACNNRQEIDRCTGFEKLFILQ